MRAAILIYLLVIISPLIKGMNNPGRPPMNRPPITDLPILLPDDDDLPVIGGQHREPSLWDFTKLIPLTPAIIAMYCYEKQPQVTMITITSLLLWVLFNSSQTKKKMISLKEKMLRNWYYLQYKSKYLWFTVFHR